MNELVHSFRPNIFSREHHYRLTDVALELNDGKVQRTVALADVAGIRIYHQSGAGYGPTIRRAILRLRSGETILLSSNHYIRFAVIDDRAATYRAFAAALVERVAAANPRAKIVLGHSWGAWVAWLFILIGSLAFLIFGLWLLVSEDFPLKALLYVGIVAAFLPVSWRIVTRSRPRPADPKALPAGTFD